MQSKHLLLLASCFVGINAQSTSLCRTATGACTLPSKVPCASVPPPRATPPPCAKDLHIISNRGTGECLGYGTNYCVAQRVVDQLSGADVDIDYNPYPAIAGPTNVPSAQDYVASESAGVRLLLQMIQTYVNACPNTPIALIGYSQGAQVVADVLLGATAQRGKFSFPPSNPLDYGQYGKNIAAAVLFGDPSFVPGAPGDFGNYTSAGSWFPRRDLSPLQLYKDKVISYCDARDSFCDCDGGNEIQMAACIFGQGRLITHSTYLYCNVYTQNAANFIVNALKKREEDEERKADLK